MIKNVIFDLGNVLLRFDPLAYLRTKVADENTVQHLYREIFSCEEWVMLDRGVITQEEAMEKMIARSLAYGDLIKFCMDGWYQILTPIDETVAILKEVKHRGYNTYVLSNFHLLAYEHVTKHYDFFKCFDGGIISCQENLVKPEKAIYDKLTLQCGLQPSESIFIDDTKININAARAAGLQTILFENPQQLRTALRELGILESGHEHECYY